MDSKTLKIYIYIYCLKTTLKVNSRRSILHLIYYKSNDTKKGEAYNIPISQRNKSKIEIKHFKVYYKRKNKKNQMISYLTFQDIFSFCYKFSRLFHSLKLKFPT